MKKVICETVIGYAVTMKPIVTLMLLVLFIITGHAEIYKGTDEEGNVIYSDKELPDSIKIPMPSPNTIIMPKPIPKQAIKKDEKEKNPYKTFKILSPSNNETLRISSGNVPVTLSVTPTLDIKQGHHISVYIDGAVTINKTTKLNLQISNVGRGSHTLRAEIRSAKNEILKQSKAVKFHLKRISSQHKKPTGTPPGPRKPDGTSYTPGPQGVTFKPGPVTP